MAANEAERWDIVNTSEHKEWLARPFDDPNGVEMIVLSKDELLHALPRSGPCPPASASVLYEVTAGSLNVRATPDTTQAAVGAMPNGTKFQAVPADVTGWLQITEGAYTGRFVSATYARPF